MSHLPAARRLAADAWGVPPRRSGHGWGLTAAVWGGALQNCGDLVIGRGNESFNMAY